MKRALTISMAALIAFSVSGSSRSAPPATQTEDSIRTIRQHYERINRSLSRYRQLKKKLSGFSAEGGVLVVYFDGKSIAKIAATYYGEMGRANEDYYYWNGQLIFVFRREFQYDRPLSGKVVRSKEDRFYFSNDRLIRWIDENARQISAGSDEYLAKEKEYLEASGKFTNAARSKKLTVEAPD